jgi:hypothetical protein
MARKFLVSIDHNKLESLNFRLQNLGTAPSSPVVGMVYFDTVTNKIKYYNASTFVDPTDRGQHTGTQTAATITNFNTAVQANPINTLTAPTAALSMAGFAITNLPNATTTDMPATYGQLLNSINGTDWKASVRALAATNVSLSGLQTIDGISLVAGERVAVTGNTTTTQNGLYSVASGAWTRTLDADATPNPDGTLKVTPSMSFMVEEGTTYAGTQWRLVTMGIISVGITGLSYSQIGAGTSYIQGSGISIIGSTISVDKSLVATKYAGTIGDGTLTTFTVTHNLNTMDIVMVFRDASTNQVYETDWQPVTVNTASATFVTAPTSNQIRVTVHG